MFDAGVDDTIQFWNSHVYHHPNTVPELLCCKGGMPLYTPDPTRKLGKDGCQCCCTDPPDRGGSEPPTGKTAQSCTNSRHESRDASPWKAP